MGGGLSEPLWPQSSCPPRASLLEPLAGSDADWACQGGGGADVGPDKSSLSSARQRGRVSWAGSAPRAMLQGPGGSRTSLARTRPRALGGSPAPWGAWGWAWGGGGSRVPPLGLPASRRSLQSRGHLALGRCARVRSPRGQFCREAPSVQRGGPGRLLSPAAGPGPQAPSPKPGRAGATGPWHRSPGTHCPSTVEGAWAACPLRNHGDWGVGPGLPVGLGLWEVLGETRSAFQGARAPPG